MRNSIYMFGVGTKPLPPLPLVYFAQLKFGRFSTLSFSLILSLRSLLGGTGLTPKKAIGKAHHYGLAFLLTSTLLLQVGC